MRTEYKLTSVILATCTVALILLVTGQGPSPGASVYAAGDPIVAQDDGRAQPALSGRELSNLISPAPMHTETDLDTVNLGDSLRPKGVAHLGTSTKSKIQGGAVFPAPRLERVSLRFHQDGGVQLPTLPRFGSTFQNKVAGITNSNDYVFYTVQPQLQAFTETMVRSSNAPHVAAVVMDPKTGRILAVADKSSSIPELSLHAGFPAASLFKLVTTSAALEEGFIEPDSLIKFRGGTYTLDKWNYKPDPRRDKYAMTVMEALGKSCNPVFARIALRWLSPRTLRDYAQIFGFNEDLQSDLDLPRSTAQIPDEDYQLGRTAAGFGEVNISPIHAATLMSGIANGGLLPRPNIIDRVISPSGAVKYNGQPEYLKRILRPNTAKTLLHMMEATTTIGTSRKEFMSRNKPVLPGIDVAAKTGTLKGTNPPGLNNWFIAAAPIENPQVAVSVIVVNPGGTSSRASHVGKRLIEKYFELHGAL